MIDETIAPAGETISVESAAVPAEGAAPQGADAASTDSETGSEKDDKLGEPDAANTGEPEKQPKRNRVPFGERISQLTKQAHLDALEIHALRNKLRVSKEAREGFTPPAGESELQRNLREEMDRREAIRDEATERHQEELTQQRQHREMVAEWESKVTDSALRDKFVNIKGVSRAMADVVAYSDHAEALTRHFVKNPEDAKRISLLSVGLQALEVREIAERLATSNPARRVSQAPEPGSTLKGGSSPTRKSAGEMPYAEYAAMRRKQVEAERR